jgi:hypothetical protein
MEPDQIPTEASAAEQVSRQEVPISYVERLLVGDLGLPMTYWVYGVLAGPVWAVCLKALAPTQIYEENTVQQYAMYFAIAYYALIYIAIWNAANKYLGSKVWAVLAKFVVVLTAAPTAIFIAKAVLQYMEHV